VIVLDPGHRYELKGNKGGRSKVLEFFKDAAINGDGYDGTTIQEVLRALIDRVLFLDAQVSGGGTLSFVGVWRTQILELEVRAAGRHGLCMFEARRVMEGWPDLVEIAPRHADGHVYPITIHTAASCEGRCSP